MRHAVCRFRCWYHLGSCRTWRFNISCPNAIHIVVMSMSHESWRQVAFQLHHCNSQNLVSATPLQQSKPCTYIPGLVKSSLSWLDHRVVAWVDIWIPLFAGSLTGRQTELQGTSHTVCPHLSGGCRLRTCYKHWDEIVCMRTTLTGRQAHVMTHPFCWHVVYTDRQRSRRRFKAYCLSRWRYNRSHYRGPEQGRFISWPCHTLH
jgi:hypothetical protein